MRIMLFLLFTAAATNEIYTLSLHDALPIYESIACLGVSQGGATILFAAAELANVKCVICESVYDEMIHAVDRRMRHYRSEEHTSELQSHHDLVCRLLLEKKKSLRRRRIQES